jgi:pyruvate-formate lyase-activating enzyme
MIEKNNLDCPMSYTVYKFQPELGEFSACCDARSYKFNEETFNELGNNYFEKHPTLIERKTQMKEGIRHSDCVQCWEKEDEGIISMRTGVGNAHQLYGKDLLATKAYPERVELWMNSTCNLGCFMCHNGNSNTLRKIWHNIPDTRGYDGAGHDKMYTTKYYTKGYKDKFEANMLSFIKNKLENMEDDFTVAYLGGEPTLHFEMYDHADMFIEAASKRNGGTPKIEIVTNGTSKDKLNERFYEMMRKYKEAGWATRIMLSQDGADKYADVRHGADFEQIRRNFSRWLSRDGLIDEVTSFTVLSNLNLPYIDKMADYMSDTILKNFDDNSTHLNINFNSLTDPKWMKVKYLPRKYATDSIERALDKFVKLKDKFGYNIVLNHSLFENIYDILPDEISQEDAEFLFKNYKYVAKRYNEVYNWDMFETFDHLKPFAKEYGIDL